MNNNSGGGPPALVGVPPLKRGVVTPWLGYLLPALKMNTVSTMCFFEHYLSTKFKFVTAWIDEFRMLWLTWATQLHTFLFCLREIARTSLVFFHLIYNID